MSLRGSKVKESRKKIRMLLTAAHLWTPWAPVWLSQPVCSLGTTSSHLTASDGAWGPDNPDWPLKGTCRHQWRVCWSCRRTTSQTALPEVVWLENRTLQLCSQAGVPPSCCNPTEHLWAQHCCSAVSQVLLGVCSAPKASCFSEKWISTIQRVEASCRSVKSKEETSSISQFSPSEPALMEQWTVCCQLYRQHSRSPPWGDTHWTANFWGEYLTERWRFSLCTHRLSQSPWKCRVMQDAGDVTLHWDGEVTSTQPQEPLSSPGLCVKLIDKA